MYYNVPSVFKLAEKNVPETARLEKGGMFKLNMQDPLKAVDSFEIEVVAYHVCLHLLRNNFCERFDDINAWLCDRKGAVAPDEADRNLIDKIFDETLAFVEFTLNRLTTYSDENMEQFMVSTMFALCYYLKVDRSRAGAHIRRKNSSVLFRKKELSMVDSICHNRFKMSLNVKNPMSYDEILAACKGECLPAYREIIQFYGIIRDTVNSDYVGKSTIYVEIEDDSTYANRLVRECWSAVDPEVADTNRGNMVPLMEIVRVMEALCRSEPVFESQVESDYEDMCADILVANSALLGFVGKRDTSLNYGTLPASAVPAKYSTSEGVDMIRHCLRTARVIDCILAGSNISKPGAVNADIGLVFAARSMIRMMDSEMFGRQVYQPNIVFINRSTKPMEDYEQYLQSLGFVAAEANHGHGFVKIVDDLQSLEISWDVSGRGPAPKPKGCFGHIRSVSHVTLGQLRQKNLNNFRNGTILVCDACQRSEVIRAVRNAVHAENADKDRVWRIVVLLEDTVSSRDYTMVDVRDGNIVEVGLHGYRRLFDTHTNGIVARTIVALNGAFTYLCDEYNVADGDVEALQALLVGDDLETAVKREFLKFYVGMSSEIEMMDF